MDLCGESTLVFLTEYVIIIITITWLVSGIVVFVLLLLPGNWISFMLVLLPPCNHDTDSSSHGTFPLCGAGAVPPRNPRLAVSASVLVTSMFAALQRLWLKAVFLFSGIVGVLFKFATSNHAHHISLACMSCCLMRKASRAL